MAHVCTACSRVNPPDALFCYFDGRALGGGRGRAPLATGSQLFVSPFVFPSGRTCRSFDELVLACHQNWSEAQDLLRRGYLEGFMGGLGRADLASVAHQAASSPDADRGLDDFLAQLPASVREPAKLLIQPTEINLGQLDRKSDRKLVLHVENQGMALLHGSAVCEDTPWLALGESTSAAPKRFFQCLHDVNLPVQVLGQRTRAGNKPLEGRIVIESNGGRATIVVRAEVPIQPFPNGVLAGARSPRQVAEKAKVSPREAAPFFENGSVAEWYRVNGWLYPIQGEPASGLGAVQQFFEALGLTTPPRVEISTQSVQLQGVGGAELEYTLQLRTVENRPVFAHAFSTVPWLKIGRISLEGRTARVRLIVPEVPDQAGERLLGKVQVTANGNQRFTVAVSLHVTGPAPRGSRASRAALAPPPLMLDEPPALQAWQQNPPPRHEAIMPPPSLLPQEVPPPIRHPLPVNHEGAPPLLVDSTPAPLREPTLAASDPSLAIPAPPRSNFLPHLVPFALIVFILLGLVIHDIILSPEKGEGGPSSSLAETEPYIALRVHDGHSGETPDELYTGMPAGSMRFGLVMLRERGSTNRPSTTVNKKLTYDLWGRTNNTCLKIDDPGDPGDEKEFLFGHKPGRWILQEEPLGKDENGRTRDGFRSVWMLDSKRLQVTQHIEVVPGDLSACLDTCLISYLLENKDTKPHRVGIRFLLDTFIGGNDGVPFTIPGASGLCDTMRAFRKASDVPDFIEAMEKEDLENPGTVARLQFRVGSRFESPTRVILGGWPDGNLKKYFNVFDARGQFTYWNVPEISMRELHNRARKLPEPQDMPPDSAVTIYWDPKPLPPGETREVGFTYGLGQVSTGQSGGRLLLSFGGRLVRNGEFTLTAQVMNPKRGEKLTLVLPEGLQLVEGATEQAVPAVPRNALRQISPVTWRIRAVSDGALKVEVRSSAGAREEKQVTIRSKGVFD